MKSVLNVAGASLLLNLRGYQLDIAVQLPDSLNNTGLCGLLGNFNGNKDDDLLSSNGQTLPPDSSEEQIYYDFGETCEFFKHYAAKASLFQTQR